MTYLPRPVLFAAVTVMTEALGIIAFAVVGVLNLVSDPARSISTAIALLVVLAIFAVGLAGAAVGLTKGYRTARSLSVTWQIFQLANGVWLSTNGFLLVGICFIMLTIAAFRFLFDSRTIAHTYRTIS